MRNERLPNSIVAWEMAYAEAPLRDKYLANRDNLKQDEIHKLSWEMGEVATRAQLQHESQPAPVFIDVGQLQTFAQERDPAGGKQRAGRAWAVLIYDRKPGNYIPLYAQAKSMMAALRQLAVAHNDRLELNATRNLITHLVLDVGYAALEERSVAFNFGPATVSFLAEYINHTFGLEAEERLPLYNRTAQTEAKLDNL